MSDERCDCYVRDDDGTRVLCDSCYVVAMRDVAELPDYARAAEIDRLARAHQAYRRSVAAGGTHVLWIHTWQDDGTLTADDKFAVELADRDEVLVDVQLWEEYVMARRTFQEAADRVRAACRPPTDAEREERRRVIREHLRAINTSTE